MYHQLLFYPFFFGTWLVDGQEDINTKVSSMDVMCDKTRMTVHMSFSSPFKGSVYSHGNFGDSNCIYVKPHSSTLDTTFDIDYETCGTIADSNGRYFENTIVIQYGADILGSDDETKRLRCEWHDSYQTSITQPVVRVSDPEPVVMNFQGDNIDCWMEILEGTTPSSRKVHGIVNLGSPMTLVIAMRDRSNQFDMRVKTCYAHDGHNEPIFLTDERGCVLRTSLMSKFKKVRDTSGRSNVMCYAHFNAFKFPDSIDVYMQCTVEVCRFGCEDLCDDGKDEDDDDDDKRHPNTFDKTKDINSKKIKDILDKKLRDLHIQRLKKLREKHLRDLQNKRLKDIRDHFLKGFDNHSLRDSGIYVEDGFKNQKMNDLQEQRLKILHEKALTKLQEQQLSDLHGLSLKNNQNDATKDISNQIISELRKKKLKDLKLKNFHLHLNDFHDKNTLENDEIIDYYSSPLLYLDKERFQDEETKIKPTTFFKSPIMSEKQDNEILSVNDEPQIANQTVAEVALSSSIYVPTMNTELSDGKADVIKGATVWKRDSPEIPTPDESSVIKISRSLMKDHDPMEEEGAMETAARNVYVGVDSHGRTAMLPMPAEFAHWLMRSSRRSIFKRTPPRVKLSLVSKTGRVLMRKYFYPVSPAIPVPPAIRSRKRKLPRRRAKRSAEELGVMKSFKVISSQDLNFDPSASGNEGRIFEGRQEISNESLCFTTANVALIFGLLSLITICSFVMTAFFFYQYRIQTCKKCDTNLNKAKTPFGESSMESAENSIQ